MEEEYKCDRCGGRMEQGFLLDRGQYGSPHNTAEWVKGLPERSIWSGIWSGIKTGGREHYLVATFRCEECGRLDSYARQLIK